MTDQAVTQSAEGRSVTENELGNMFRGMLGGASEDQPAAKQEPTAEAEDGESPTEETSEATDAPRKFKVPALEGDGEEELTADELKSQRLMHKDYTQKTQAAAELRKQAEAKLSEADKIASERIGQLEQDLAVAANLIRSYDQEINWEALQQLDPAEYIRQREQQAHRAQAWNQTRERVESMKGDAKKAKQALAAQRLVEAIPEWLDPVRAQAEGTKLLQGSEKHYGLTAADIDGIADHRVVVALRDALAYRELKDKSASVKAEVQKAPVMAKPGNVSQGNPQALKTHRTIEKAKQSGKTEDAAAAFDAFLGAPRRK